MFAKFFDQNFDFWLKFQFLAKISIFGPKFLLYYSKIKKYNYYKKTYLLLF